MINLYKLHKEKLDYYEKYNDALELLDIQLKHYGVFDPGDVSVLKNVLHIIKREPNLAFWYADVIIKGRWEEVEPTIMKAPEMAYNYALDIIKGRWKEAEPYIMTSPYYAYYYARYITKERFPAAESIIMKNSIYAYYYARDIIEGRWIEAEPYIMESDEDWRWYCHEFKLC